MDKPDGLPAPQVLKAVEQLVPPTEFEQETYPRNPSVRRYEKTIRFATITSVKAGYARWCRRQTCSALTVRGEVSEVLLELLGGQPAPGEGVQQFARRDALPGIVAAGVATEEEVDIDTLAERLHADTGPVGRISFWPTVIGAYATKPQ